MAAGVEVQDPAVDDIGLRVQQEGDRPGDLGGGREPVE
jgi:hypothetical protein